MAMYVEDFREIMTAPADQWHRVFMRHRDDADWERVNAAFEWCHASTDPGLWSEWTYSDGSEFRFTNSEMAFMFKMRWC
ncbi:MAG: hypothetical protein EOP83_08630 [Verrucomicrobiaceae bacterium]|nr:MAG: hypothetical protein EOP83_08630 [Verrucomicrobiaceae bacterium]